MSNYLPYGRLVWSLQMANLGTTLTASVNGNEFNLREVGDLWLAVAVTGAAGTTPTLDVSLDIKDAANPANWFPSGLAAPQLTAPGQAQVSGGLHSAAKPLVLPERGRIKIVVGGTTPVFSGVAVSLYGR